MFGLHITHPQVKIDPSIPVPQWGLSDLGKTRSQKAAAQPWASHRGRIISSDETKALETAAILANAAGISVEIIEDLHENDRSATGFLPPQAFEAVADPFFAEPLESFRGWERAADAQARIIAAVAGILDRHDPRIPIAFIAHGGVGTLLRCHLLGIPISRSQDQPGGGDQLYRFSLADRVVSCDWTPMEHWQGD